MTVLPEWILVAKQRVEKRAKELPIPGLGDGNELIRSDVPRLVELVGEMAEALESVVCVFDAMNDVELSLHVGMEAARAQRAARQVLAKYRGEEDKP